MKAKYTLTRMYNSLYMHINHIYATRLVFFLHALKVPHIVYHNLHRKNIYTLVMKKVHEQVAKIS